MVQNQPMCISNFLCYMPRWLSFLLFLIFSCAFVFDNSRASRHRRCKIFLTLECEIGQCRDWEFASKTVEMSFPSGMLQQYDIKAGKQLHVFNDLSFTRNTSFTDSHKGLQIKGMALCNTFILGSRAVLLLVRRTESYRVMNRKDSNPYVENISLWNSSRSFALLLPLPLTAKNCIDANPFHITDRLDQYEMFNCTACTGYRTSAWIFHIFAVLSVNNWMYPVKDFSLPSWY